jgi:Kef-type K+ transport system membrane component KefB
VIESSAPTLILVSTAAFVLPIVAGRLRLPPVVLEILTGMVAGPILGLVHGVELLDGLAGVGFLMLLFLSGFELDFGLFQRQGAKPILMGLLVFIGTLGCAFVAAQLLSLGIFATLVLSTTSIGLVVPMLRTSRLNVTALGQDILICALLADFLTLLAVTVVALATEHGLGFQLLALPAFALIAVVALLGLRQAAWWWPEHFGRLFDENDPDELGIRFSLALMLLFVGVAIVLGIEPILGAFLAGTSVAAVFRNRGGLDRKLEGFAYGWLIPIFFINVGIRFQLEAISDPGAIAFTLVLFVAAILVKVIPSLALVLRGHSLGEALASGLLLSARLSLIIVVAQLGADLGLISEQLRAQIILLAALTATIAPAGFRFAMSRARGAVATGPGRSGPGGSATRRGPAAAG